MTTQAAIGHGSIFAIGDGGTTEVFTPVAEVTNITAPAFARDTPDATHMASPEKWREFIPGLRDPGEVSISVNFIPGGASQEALIDAFTTDLLKNFRVTFAPVGGSPAEIWNFAGYCVGFAPEVPLDGKMTATARIKLSGKPEYVA